MDPGKSIFFLNNFFLCYKNYKERKTRLKKQMSYKCKKTLCIVRYMVGSVIPNLYASRKVNIKLKKLRKYTGCLMFRGAFGIIGLSNLYK